MFLLINVADLSALSTIDPFGSPLNLLIRPDLGDSLLKIGVHNTNRLDEIFSVVECTPERAEAISDALAVIGKAKLKRKIRIRLSEQLPNGNQWKQITS